MTNRDTDTVLERARTLLAQGAVGERRLQHAARLAPPLPVVQASGALDSWFIPVLLGERMAGFIQLTVDLTLLRYSGFPEPVDAALWMDLDTISSCARQLLGPDADLSAPRLSFDNTRERIAWRVQAKNSAGEVRTVFVAGEYAYERSADGPT